MLSVVEELKLKNNYHAERSRSMKTKNKFHAERSRSMRISKKYFLFLCVIEALAQVHSNAYSQVKEEEKDLLEAIDSRNFPALDEMKFEDVKLRLKQILGFANIADRNLSQQFY